MKREKRKNYGNYQREQTGTPEKIAFNFHSSCLWKSYIRKKLQGEISGIAPENMLTWKR
jgi:hypothetical protein